MNKLKRDDEVIVVAGKDKGKRGTISQLVGDDRIIVAGVNMVKRHTKPNPNLGQPGGIVEREASLHISNVAIFNSETNKADRVGIEVLEDGEQSHATLLDLRRARGRTGGGERRTATDGRTDGRMDGRTDIRLSVRT